MNLFAGQEQRLRYREQIYGQGVGCGGRKSETNGESRVEIYTLPYVKIESQWEYAV